MDTQKNGFIYEGIVMGDPKELKNDKTHEVIGHSVDLAQTGERITFYIPKTVLDEINTGDTVVVQGRLKQAQSGWAKATSCDKAKILSRATLPDKVTPAA